MKRFTLKQLTEGRFTSQSEKVIFTVFGEQKIHSKAIALPKSEYVLI